MRAMILKVTVTMTISKKPPENTVEVRDCLLNVIYIQNV